MKEYKSFIGLPTPGLYRLLRRHKSLKSVVTDSAYREMVSAEGVLVSAIMLLIIEIALGIIFGLWLADALKKKLTNRTHRLNVRRFQTAVLHWDLNALMTAALDGYDYLFTRSNRELFITLAREKEESKRFDLAEAIAQDAAERFYAMERGERLPSVMSDGDKEWVQKIKDKIDEDRVFREQMAAVRTEVGDETYERAKRVMKDSGYDLP